MDARVDQGVPDSKEMSDLILRVMVGVNDMSFKRWGNRVLTGPFGGMIIPQRSPWDDGNASTKLLGTYEHELHEVIEYSLWRQPVTVVNVGCAEGYYAIGYARKEGVDTVYAFDINEESRLIAQDYAERNKVTINTLHGAHAPEQLIVTSPGRTLYFFDCEGEEETLIDLDRCPPLAGADIIVECHDFLKPGISCKIADRLSATHRVELVKPSLPDMRILQRMPTAFGVLAVVEKRPMPCCWLACWANKQ
jgi:hypothetical protein